MADQPETEQQRGVPVEKVLAKMTAAAGGKDQQLAIAQVVIDDLTEQLAAEREANADLRAELVKATAGDPAGKSPART